MLSRGATGQLLEHEIRPAVGGDTNVEDADEALVAEPSLHASVYLLHPQDQLLTPRQLERQELEGVFDAGLLVAGGPDLIAVRGPHRVVQSSE